jgi:hypothetical protein
MDFDIMIVDPGLTGSSVTIRLKQLNLNLSVFVLEKGLKSVRLSYRVRLLIPSVSTGYDQSGRRRWNSDITST